MNIAPATPSMRERTCRRHLFYIPMVLHREAANARTHLQTAPVLHATGYAPRSRQRAGTLAEGIRFTYRWLCTEKPPMRGHTCRRHPFYIPMAMHREAANAQTHLQTVPQPPQCHMPFQQRDHRTRHAQRNVRYAVPELACRFHRRLERMANAHMP